MSQASWYVNMKGGHSDPSVFIPSTTESVEFGLSLDSTFKTTTGWEALTEASSGILKTCCAVFQLTASFRDVKDDEDSVWYNAGTQNFDVVVPLQTATGTEGGAKAAVTITSEESTFSLLLYVGIDLKDHLSFDVPSTKTTGYTRRLAAKGVRGVLILPTPAAGEAYDPSATISGIGTSALAYTANPSIMDQMNATQPTNCLPGAPANTDWSGCGPSSAVPSSVHASGDYLSTEVPCTAGPWPSTHCTKVYNASAPMRKLLYLAQVPRAVVSSSGIWSADSSAPNERILYTKHGATSGLLIHNSAPCFQYPDCGSGAASASTFPVWAIVVIAVVGAGVLSISIWAALHFHGVRAHSARINKEVMGLATSSSHRRIYPLGLPPGI